MKLHLFQFDTEAAAQADPIVGAYWTPPFDDPNFGPQAGHWDESQTFPGVSVYANANPASGWWTIVASDDSNTALAQDANCRLAWDNLSAVILGGTYTGNDMSALFVTPVPAGAYNPWNGAVPA